MVDLGAVASALSSLKAAKDIAESMIGLRDAAILQLTDKTDSTGRLKQWACHL
jgi:hypothetical protein